MTDQTRNNARQTISTIAREVLDLETLETRKRDSLDFHELSVWQIREALEAAYEAGRQSTRKDRHEVIRGDGRKVRVSIPRDEK